MQWIESSFIFTVILLMLVHAETVWWNLKYRHSVGYDEIMTGSDPNVSRFTEAVFTQTCLDKGPPPFYRHISVQPQGDK